jgi:hypothetical protein
VLRDIIPLSTVLFFVLRDIILLSREAMHI